MKRTIATGLLGLAALGAAVPAIGATTGRAGASAPAATRPTATARIRTAAKQAGSSPRVSISAVKTAASLGPLINFIQTLNNCGPASVAEVLAYYHIYRTQAQTAAFLRADAGIWGMSHLGLTAYAQTLGMRAMVGFGGNERLVKALISNGFPVIVSQWVSSYDNTRHYRPIYAYNDRTQTFVSSDPYLGAGHVISYAEFNAIWAESDYRFQIIYPASRQAQLNAVLTSVGWNRQRTYAQALRWELARMNSSDLHTPGTWLWANAYPDVAWDEAQLGNYKAAQAALVQAARLGDSPVLTGWVKQEMQALQRGAQA